MPGQVLVVDDNMSDLIMTSNHVESEGYETVQANNGIDALDKLADHQFSLFIIDLQMPRMGGIELIQRLKRMSEMKDTPILVTSARREPRDSRLAVHTGANDYLIKPIDTQIFEEKFRRILGKFEDWCSYKLDQNSDESDANLQIPIKILEFNEIEAKVSSSLPRELGTHIDLESALLTRHEAPRLLTKVETCEKKGDLYEMRLKYVGVTEETRAKIRKICRQLYFERAAKRQEMEDR